ncbi:minor capsid protein [Chryseomicrobium aureum]|uniref:minor capsid protein n=1 Tax=Chryseomicrobium aureum TaxID=1441723 RepID=UPI00370D489E
MQTEELIEHLITLGYSVYPEPNFIPDIEEDTKFPCLFVIANGGGATDEYLPIRFPSFQIVVKGKNAKTTPNQFVDTEALAQGLIDFFDQKTNFIIGTNTIYYCRSQSSMPIPIGLDLRDRPTYSLNFNFKLQPNLKGAN